MPESKILVATADEVSGFPAFNEGLLTAAERGRADGFHHDRDRRDFVAGHVLLRMAAADLLGGPVEDVCLVQECDRCGGPHGRPAVLHHPEVRLSLSHTRGVVAAAADRGPVGVDLEQITRRPTVLAVYERVLTGPELHAALSAPDPHRAFLRLWVRKEALIKVSRASLDSLQNIDLAHLPPDDSALSGIAVPIGPEWPDLWLLDWFDDDLGIVGAAVAQNAPTMPLRTARRRGRLRAQTVCRRRASGRDLTGKLSWVAGRRSLAGSAYICREVRCSVSVRVLVWMCMPGRWRRVALMG